MKEFKNKTNNLFSTDITNNNRYNFSSTTTKNRINDKINELSAILQNKEYNRGVNKPKININKRELDVSPKVYLNYSPIKRNRLTLIEEYKKKKGVSEWKLDA